MVTLSKGVQENDMWGDAYPEYFQLNFCGTAVDKMQHIGSNLVHPTKSNKIQEFFQMRSTNPETRNLKLKLFLFLTLFFDCIFVRFDADNNEEKN